MGGIGWVLSVAAALLIADRALLAAERRGWVYWRRKGPAPGAAGMAMLEVQSLFEPDRQHVVDEIRRTAADIDHAADDEPLGQQRPGGTAETSGADA